MTSLVLPPRITVSGVNELLHLAEQIDTLSTRRDEVASHIVEDADFMGGRLLHLRYFQVRGVQSASLGTVFHVARCEYEYRDDPDDFNAHPAGRCPSSLRRHWCELQQNEKVRIPYTREPNRSWRTFLGTWLLVGRDDTAGTATFLAIGQAE